MGVYFADTGVENALGYFGNVAHAELFRLLASIGRATLRTHGRFGSGLGQPQGPGPWGHGTHGHGPRGHGPRDRSTVVLVTQNRRAACS